MYYRTLPVLLLVAVLFIVLYHVKDTSFFSLPSSTTLQLTAEEARRQRFALILDVRTPREREEFGFYPNSIPVDASQLQEEVPYLLGEKPGRQRHERPPRTTPILVYSNAGDGRAQRAAETLYDLGFVGVRYIQESYLRMLPPGENSSL